MIDRKQEAIDHIALELDRAWRMGVRWEKGKNIGIYSTKTAAEPFYNRIAPLMATPEIPSVANSPGETADPTPREEVTYVRQSRGFPEKAFQAIIDDAWCRGHNYVAAPARKEPDWEDTADLIARARCLFEGRPSREGDNILEQEQIKGACQSCGGTGLSGLTSWDEEQRHGEVLYCLECGGAGEDRRSGRERREKSFIGLGDRRIPADRRTAG